MDLIYVQWWDAHNRDGWTSTETAISECGPHAIDSVGWLIAKNDEHLTIAPHIAPHSVEGYMHIPISAIKKRKKLPNPLSK